MTSSPPSSSSLPSSSSASSFFSEADWERLVIDELEDLAEHSWAVANGPAIAPGSGGPHTRASWDDLVLPSVLHEAVARLNPSLPASEVAEVVTKVSTPSSREAFAENKRAHDFLVHGVKHTYTDESGASQTPTIHLIDERDPYANDFRAVQQVTVRNADYERRFDIVLYVNGMPLGFIELKRSSPDGEELATAHAQLATYRDEFPLAYRFNALCVVTDGTAASYGTAFTPFEHFAPWNVDEDGKPLPSSPLTADDTELIALVHGLLSPRRFISIINDYIAFTRGAQPTKRIAKPHQYFAVEKAVGTTITAVRGDQKAGVVWHTQGSGKSFEMELYTARVAKEAALGNPTVVVLSDRTELDKQLYEGFAASELLSGVDTIGSRTDLREKLATQGAGGIYFSTLQKFGLTEAEKKSGAKHPLLSNRRNVIVIADEAHRSHYGDLDGYARWLRQALPNATMIAFTGTPLSTADRDTRAVFGDYIDVYDLTRAANDGATVRVYFDSRLAPVDFAANVDIEELDEEVDEITLGLDDAERRSIEQRVATLNAVYGAPSRLDAIAADLVEHWESRGAAMAPLVGGTGKALLVCATREICGDMYDRIVALRPDWHDDADLEGRIKVVFSSSDPKDKQNPKLAKHIRRPAATDALKARIRALDDPLEIVIVQGMLLTGFDGPPLHTMYLDRPLKGATLMQALARVNRKCGEKQDGLLVGYAPVTENLHEALAEYTKADRENRPVGADIDEAIAKLRDEVGVVNTMLEGCRWRTILHGGGRRAGLNAILEAVNFLRDPAHADNAEPPGEHNLPQRFRLATQRLERFWALCSNDRKIEDLRDDIGFFRAVRIQLMRMDADARKAAGKPVRADIEKHLRMVADSVIEADGVKDIYAMAGVDLPDLTNINEDYLARLRASAHPHIAIEALRRLVEQEMRKVMRHNLVQRGRFSEALDELMRRYTNQNLDSAQIIAELVAMARDIVNERDRGNSYTPPLDREEIAFYDAVATNESAILQMGTDTLADIARDLVKTLRRDLKTDWSVRADVRAKMRSTIRRLLMRHGYPPDQQPAAVQRVIQQMETFAGDWAPAADHRD